MRNKPHNWTQEQMDFFIEHYTTGKYTRKQMLEMINIRFNLQLNETQIQVIGRRLKVKSGRSGRFEKGQTVWNKGLKGIDLAGENGKKTQFKKGQKPTNYRPIGSERICSKDGYVLIKVSDKESQHRRWRHKHQVIWEQHNGSIPKNHVVIFLDGNKMNTSIENLALITRQDLLNMNRHKLFHDDIDSTKTGVLVAKIYSKISDLNSKKGVALDEKRQSSSKIGQNSHE